MAATPILARDTNSTAGGHSGSGGGGGLWQGGMSIAGVGGSLRFRVSVNRTTVVECIPVSLT